MPMTRRTSSAWTGRAPRTCQEAFGPYTSYAVTAPSESHRTAWIIWAVLTVALILVIICA